MRRLGCPPPASLAAYLDLLDGCPVPWAVSVAGGDVVASEVAPLAWLRAVGELLGNAELGEDALRREEVADAHEQAVDGGAAEGRAGGQRVARTRAGSGG